MPSVLVAIERAVVEAGLQRKVRLVGRHGKGVHVDVIRNAVTIVICVPQIGNVIAIGVDAGCSANWLWSFLKIALENRSTRRNYCLFRGDYCKMWW